MVSRCPSFKKAASSGGPSKSSIRFSLPFLSTMRMYAVVANERLPKRVQGGEVSPRDGLQAESRPLPTEAKLELITRLAEAGHTVIEATSFVNPKAVPQLADAEELLRALKRRPGVRYPVLVPNEKGLDRPLAAGD